MSNFYNLFKIFRYSFLNEEQNQFFKICNQKEEKSQLFHLLNLNNKEKIQKQMYVKPQNTIKKKSQLKLKPKSNRLGKKR